MSLAAPHSVPEEVPALTVFLRAMAAEWTRLWTLRSTWWALLMGAALMVSIGSVAAANHTPGEPAPIWVAAQIAMVPGQFAFLFVVLLAAAGEYSTGAIRSSLQWVPKRELLLAARLLVPVAVVMVCSVLVSAAADVTAWVLLGTAAEVVPRDIAASLGRIALVVAFGGVLTVGLSLFLRSAAGAVTTLFLLLFALPVALGNSGVPALIAVSDALPGRAIVSLLVSGEAEVAPQTVVAVMIAWTAATVVAGGWSLIRRDTS